MEGPLRMRLSIGICSLGPRASDAFKAPVGRGRATCQGHQHPDDQQDRRQERKGKDRDFHATLGKGP